MTSVLADAAKAVANAINATTHYSYGEWAKSLETFDGEGRRLDVVPGAYERIEPIDRRSVEYTVTVNVFVRQRLTPHSGSSTEEEYSLAFHSSIDELLAYIEELNQNFWAMNTFGCFTHLETRIPVPFDPDYLRTKHLFLARLEVVVQAARRVGARTHLMSNP